MTGMVDEEELADRQARERCHAFLHRPPPPSMREQLLRLAERPEAEGAQDLYGQGGPIHVLQERVAGLLGKPAARFVIKGVIAQQSLIRAWCERSGRRTVLLHNDSHLGIDEGSGLEQLHGLRVLRFGGPTHVTVKDLAGVHEPLGVVVVEIPLRRQGFRLPEWEDLVGVSRWCREAGVPIHLDGARLWEAAPAYGRSEAEIATLFDSVYVSFYKGLAGLAGAAVAGEQDLLDEAAPWSARLGGNVHSVFPQVLSALDGLDTLRPRLPAHRDRALELGAALEGLDGLIVEQPRSSYFCVHLRGDADHLRRQRRIVAEQTGIWLFTNPLPSRLPGYVTVEVAVTDGLARVTNDDVRRALELLLSGAG